VATSNASFFGGLVLLPGSETVLIEQRMDRENFVERLAQVAEDTQTAIYAWALLDNHAHVLLRSGPAGNAACMRRILTGYAVSYNRRHRRYGYLFQNRYKSIICAVSEVRWKLTLKLVQGLGLSLAETGRQVGLATSGVAQILRRQK
jgi:REP element-mobilizing transposase RayT